MKAGSLNTRVCTRVKCKNHKALIINNLTLPITDILVGDGEHNNMTTEQKNELSHYFDSQVSLPAEIKAIAQEIKEELYPIEKVVENKTTVKTVKKTKK